MGTRSLTVVRENEKGKDIIVLYRQYDGYPKGHGQELKDFLSPFTVVNGISSDTPKKSANGMGCLAAQLVTHFKSQSEIGGFYLEPSGTRDCGEEYIYTVYMQKDKAKAGTFSSTAGAGKLMLKVQSGCVTFFGMPGTKQDHMPVIYQGPVAEFDPEQADKVQEKLETPPNDFIESKKVAS